MSAYSPLRGRIIIRPTGDSGGYADQFRKAGLVMPDTLQFDPRKERNQNSLGRGVVVAMGPPARDKWGAERDPDFRVGDEVLHVGQHVSRLYTWNGEQVRACSQEEVCAVIEEDWETVRTLASELASAPPSEGTRIARALADTDPAPEFGTEGMSE